jgi:hypothetical protein
MPHASVGAPPRDEVLLQNRRAIAPQQLLLQYKKSAAGCTIAAHWHWHCATVNKTVPAMQERAPPLTTIREKERE